MFAHAKAHVAGGVVLAAEVARSGDQGVGAGRQVGVAADHGLDAARQRVQNLAASLAGGHCAASRVESGQVGVPVRR